MKVQQIITAMDSRGNCYSTMEEIAGFRTTYAGHSFLYYLNTINLDTILIIDEEDNQIISAWKESKDKKMPRFDLSITDFINALKDMEVLDKEEIVTDVYTVDAYSLRVEIIEES